MATSSSMVVTGNVISSSRFYDFTDNLRGHSTQLNLFVDQALEDVLCLSRITIENKEGKEIPLCLTHMQIIAIRELFRRLIRFTYDETLTKTSTAFYDEIKKKFPDIEDLPELVSSRGVIYADTMGLGKSLVTICLIACFIQLKKETYHMDDCDMSGKVLIIAPPSAFSVLENEFRMYGFFAMSVTTLPGTNKVTNASIINIFKSGDRLRNVLLLTPDQFTKHKHQLAIICWDLVCMDEAHMFKKKDTQITNLNVMQRDLYELITSKDCTATLMITATPMPNTFWELLSLMHLGDILTVFGLNQSSFVAIWKKTMDKEINKWTFGLAVTGILKDLVNFLPEYIFRRSTNPNILPKHTLTIETKLTDVQKQLYEAEAMKAILKLQKWPTIVVDDKIIQELRSNNALFNSAMDIQSSNVANATGDGEVAKKQKFDVGTYVRVQNIVLGVDENSKDDTDKDIMNDQTDEGTGEEESDDIDSFSLSMNTSAGMGPTQQFMRNAQSNQRLSTSYESVLSLVQNNGKLIQLYAILNVCVIQHREKVVIISARPVMLSLVMKLLDRLQIQYINIDGETKRKDRQAKAMEFNTNPLIEVAVITKEAGGVSLTLTASRIAVQIEPHIVPSFDAQSTARVYRTSQTRPVLEFRLVTRHTYEVFARNVALTKEEATNMLLPDDKTHITVREEDAPGMIVDEVLQEDKDDVEMEDGSAPVGLKAIQSLFPVVPLLKHTVITSHVPIGSQDVTVNKIFEDVMKEVSSCIRLEPKYYILQNI